MFRSLPLALLLACSPSPEPQATPLVMPQVTPKPAAPVRPKSDAEKTVLDVAVGSPDHTTLVAAVKASDLVNALGSPGGIYTVFAPTDAAFAKLPAGTVEGLLAPEKKADLRRIVQHHAAVPILEVAQMQDGQKLAMSDGSSVTLHVTDGKVRVDDANIIASVRTVNGVVHVVDGVLLPPS